MSVLLFYTALLAFDLASGNALPVLSGVGDITALMSGYHAGRAALVGAMLMIALPAIWAVGAWFWMCWAVRPVTWGTAYRHTLTRLLLLSPFYALWVFIFLAAITQWGAEVRYDTYFGRWTNKNVAMYSFATFFVLLLPLITMIAVAIDWHRPRVSRDVFWPTTCEGCRQLVIGLTVAAECPYCGRGGQDLPGVGLPVLDRDEVGWLLRGSLQPKSVGEQIALAPRSRNFRRMALLVMALVFIVTLLTSFLRSLAFPELASVYGAKTHVDYLLAAMFRAGVVSVVALGAMLCAASSQAACARVFTKRVTLYTSINVAVYSGAALVVIAILDAVGLYILAMLFTARLDATPLPGIQVLMVVLGARALLLLGYFAVTDSMMSGIRGLSA